jgi:hypothetical protein
MAQFYVLSVLVNILGGFFLAGDIISKKFSSSDFCDKILKSEIHLLIFSIIALVAGIFKIITPFDGIYVVGDLLPAIASLTITAYFFCKYLLEKKGVLEGTFGSIDEFIEKFKAIIGIVCMIIAFLHFLFPKALFL